MLSICRVVAAEDHNVVKFGLFVDAYYDYDFNGISKRKRDYVTQEVYNDAPNVNLGLLDSKFADNDFRFRIAGQVGDSVNTNYAAEPHQWVRTIQESSVGLGVTKDLWLDIGIFPSHIGSESWISKDNPTYSRSLIAEFSPYYQEGVKSSYQISKTISTQIHLLNGWQNISDRSHPALGTQVIWKTNPNLSLTQNTFLGDENYGERFLHDFIVNYALIPTVSFINAIDVGLQKNDLTGNTDLYWGTSSILKWLATESLAYSLRFENYSDPHAAIVASVAQGSFRAQGFSLGADYSLSSQWMVRGEVKALFSGDKVFSTHTGISNSDTVAIVAINYSL